MERTQPKGLSASWLKYFACFFMLIDHLAHIWNPIYDLAARTMPPALWGNAMYYLGRLVFPIFVFLVAEGCRRTHDMNRYLLRLGGFALIAQVPFSLLFQTWGGSVILTFFLGALAVLCYQKLRPHVNTALALLPAVSLAVIAYVLDTDYGWIGVLLVPALYLCGESRKRQLICLTLGLALSYLVDAPLRYLVNYWIPPGVPFFGALAQVLPPYLEQYLPFHLLTFASACLALIPLSLYVGNRGKGNKWFFYWFYPLHLLVLWGLDFLIA